jgi:hypothetical protein
VSSVRRTRPEVSNMYWTHRVQYLPDFYNDERGQDCKRYVGI